MVDLGSRGFWFEIHRRHCILSLSKFNLLLSPYPCFISLLYLDLYVLGDGALVS